MKTTQLTLIILLLALEGFSAHAATYRVNQDGTGDFMLIQEAIDAAVDGDEIIVHPGTYYENIHFDSKNITLRSTDPDDWDVVEATVIDGQYGYTAVTFTGIEDETCLLSGFIITGGGGGWGGGISGGDAWSDPQVCTSARINRCLITGNWAYHGAGLALCGGAITKCLITDNWTSNGHSGGGLEACHGLISGCKITENESTSGGGLCNCDGIIENCVIGGNIASGEYRWGGGLSGCDGKIEDCIIRNNSFGGLVNSDAMIINCLIVGNSVTDCDGSIENCTIGEGTTGETTVLARCDASIINSIIFVGLSGCDDAVITYCCIQGWTAGGEGNISADPMLIPGPLGDYYLDPESPCINAGSQSAADAGLSDCTTQADGTPDTGIVDMGYHYPIPQDEVDVEVSCSLIDDSFAPGDELTGSISLSNHGSDIWLDVYLGFVL
ncbi:MAG: hypothetical protein JW941_04105, partial [Candidatus Coatesbacteria bacterium]|nr:hypothetical protein [Candidatus Coatesbacteria bacterium]